MSQTKCWFSAFVLILAMLLLGSCSREAVSTAKIKSSEELRSMFTEDQKVRMSDNHEPTGPSDAQRRQRVFELIAENAVRTAEDEFNAAMILNHTSLKYCGDEIVSSNPENYYLAHQLAVNSLAKGHEVSRMLVAQTIDRYLYYTTGQQKYGTHRYIDKETGREVLAPVDGSTTDEERAEFGIRPLAELKELYGP